LCLKDFVKDFVFPLELENKSHIQPLLLCDQILHGCGGPLDHLVEMYSNDGEAFAKDFAKAMVKMHGGHTASSRDAFGSETQVLDGERTIIEELIQNENQPRLSNSICTK
jgi:hypothetical protein